MDAVEHADRGTDGLSRREQFSGLAGALHNQGVVALFMKGRLTGRPSVAGTG
jgi:hypothetical protein